MKYTLTDEDFKLFKAECQKWIDRLHLGDWDYTYERGGSKTMFSTASINDEAKSVLIRFPTAWNFSFTLENKEMEIKKTALHEVLEILITTLQNPDLIKQPSLYDSEKHRIIHRLENILKETKGEKK